MFVTVEKDVHIFVQDVNPGPGSKTVFFVHGWPLKSSNVPISTQRVTTARFPLHRYGYTRKWAV